MSRNRKFVRKETLWRLNLDFFDWTICYFTTTFALILFPFCHLITCVCVFSVLFTSRLCFFSVFWRYIFLFLNFAHWGQISPLTLCVFVFIFKTHFTNKLYLPFQLKTWQSTLLEANVSFSSCVPKNSSLKWETDDITVLPIYRLF